jgi:hypothetical protein
MIVRTALLVFLALIVGCSNNSYTTAEVPKKAPLAEPVGEVALRRVSGRLLPLDIGIAIFDQGLQNANEDGRVFPTVRKAESLLIPVTLAQTLVESGAWGAVRVTHSPDVQLPIVVEGEILTADGAVLELQLRARSARGDVLLSRIYRDEATPADYPVAVGGEPFADIYRAISNDLALIAERLDDAQRIELQRVAMLRFATELAPTSFARFLSTDSTGHYELVSFPAEGDPMLSRLSRLRRQDELFVDSVHDQYSDLREEVQESYALWREYSFELQRYGEDYRETASQRKTSARRGSYAAMQQVYTSYRKVKIQEEDLRQLVRGFSGESLETVLEVDDGVFKLSGSVQQRYEEWQGILSRIDALETGGLPAATP